MAMMLGVWKGKMKCDTGTYFVATCNAINIGAHPYLLMWIKTQWALPAAVESWLKENAELRGNVCLIKIREDG